MATVIVDSASPELDSVGNFFVNLVVDSRNVTMYELNSQGNQYGHGGQYKSCKSKNILCGQLKCELLDKRNLEAAKANMLKINAKPWVRFRETANYDKYFIVLAEFHLDDWRHSSVAHAV